MLKGIPSYLSSNNDNGTPPSKHYIEKNNIMNFLKQINKGITK